MGLLVAVSGNSIYSAVNSIINFLASFDKAVSENLDIIAPVLGAVAFILFILP